MQHPEITMDDIVLFLYYVSRLRIYVYIPTVLQVFGQKPNIPR